jgi:hypothetical protein
VDEDVVVLGSEQHVDEDVVVLGSEQARTGTHGREQQHRGE